MKVLLVEDSLTVRTYLERILRGAPDVELLPSARDGAMGVGLALSHKPDVVLMDLELPVLSGLEAIREIMDSSPRPIVVLSGVLDKTDIDRTLESFRLGAVEVVAKPRGVSPAEQAQFGERLLRILRVMSQARVIRRRLPSGDLPLVAPQKPLPKQTGRTPQAILIGASTGGPLVLRQILDGLGAPFALPIVICQHIVPGFESGLASWLSESGHRVKVAEQGERVLPAIIYLSPSDHHCVLAPGLDGIRISLVPAVRGRVAPSADMLFESGAKAFGEACIALLLTGMGEDGKQGLLALRREGALTITQSAVTCVVDGMPGAARLAGASVLDLSPARMIELLREINRKP